MASAGGGALLSALAVVVGLLSFRLMIGIVGTVAQFHRDGAGVGGAGVRDRDPGSRLRRCRATAELPTSNKETRHGERGVGPPGRTDRHLGGFKGIDVSFHNEDGKIGETGYFERSTFKPFGPVANGVQELYGLDYRMAA